MTRLRDTRTGVVVDVDDAAAARLGSAYEPVDESKKPARKRSTKTDDE